MRFLCLLASLILVPGAAIGVKHPLFTGDIQAHLTAAQVLQDQIKGIKDKAGPNSDSPEIKAAIARLTVRRDTERDRAIHMTLLAYGIVPADRENHPEDQFGSSVVPGPYNGKRAHWIPIASDNETRQTTTASGAPLPQDPCPPDEETGQPQQACTFRDGVTLLYPEAFGSPALLASTLFHEHVHFRQFITAGKGDSKLGRPEWEAEAYAEEEAHFADFGFTPAEAEIENRLLHGYSDRNGFHEGMVMLWRKRRTAAKNKVLGGWPGGGKGTAPVPVHTDEELESIRERAAKLADQIQKETTAAHQVPPQRALIPQSMIDMMAGTEQAHDVQPRGMIPQSDLDSFARQKADQDWIRLKDAMFSMRRVAVALCHDDSLLAQTPSRPLRAKLAQFAKARSAYLETGRQTTTPPGYIPFKEEWVFTRLTGCELDAMQALNSKDPALSEEENDSDESWALNTTRSLRHLGSTPPAGSAGVAHSGSSSSSPSAPGGLSGPAWSQLNSWPHF